MRYWGIFLAKVLAIVGFVKGSWLLMEWLMPTHTAFLYHRFRPFGHDLNWTVAVLLLFLVTVALVYLAILDQTYRCRHCGRRLRMPLLRGSYSRMLQEGRPQFDYICPFGHGTLSVPGTRFQGRDPLVWRANKDWWQSLIAADRANR